MRLPIGYALGYPDRLPVAFGAIDWSALTALTFEPPDLEAFPCLGLAYAAGRSGGTLPAWLNAGNEVAVAAFLEGRIRWTAIAAVIEETLSQWDGGLGSTAEEIIDADRSARQRAGVVVGRVAA
jgi:1-deoxy-D-xylulose-5-phosphate reductoisomerase